MDKYWMLEKFTFEYIQMILIKIGVGVMGI